MVSTSLRYEILTTPNIITNNKSLITNKTTIGLINNLTTSLTNYLRSTKSNSKNQITTNVTINDLIINNVTITTTTNNMSNIDNINNGYLVLTTNSMSNIDNTGIGYLVLYLAIILIGAFFFLTSIIVLCKMNEGGRCIERCKERYRRKKIKPMRIVSSR